jgi:hypothetical protein
MHRRFTDYLDFICYANYTPYADYRYFFLVLVTVELCIADHVSSLLFHSQLLVNSVVLP